MTGVVSFLYGLVATLTTINALRRPSPPDSRLPAIWLPAMLVGELAPGVFTFRLLAGGGLVAAGAAETRLGRWGLGLLLLSQLGLGWIMGQSWRAARELAAHHPDDARPRLSWWERLTGWPYRIPREVELIGELPYDGDLTLDLYRRKDCPAPAPAFVFVPGGGWTGGNPKQTSRLLLHHLASRGWVVAAIRYPLSPEATFPDHLVGVKRALAWVKTEGRAFGVDPDRVVIGGGSAGGHLASLAALTAGEARHQPGFDEVDLSVRACVSLYGVYDFLNRNRTRPDWPVIPAQVMKQPAEEDPEAYREASPIDQVGSHAPPFLVVHGSHDSLIPPSEADHFVDVLVRESQSTVRHIEVRGAQHAFDAPASRRVRALVGVITAFAEQAVAGAGERGAS